MTEQKTPEHVEWCRTLMRTLADGGTWGIPRCGLIFIKRGDALVLTGRMPHDPAMPITAEDLRAFQQRDYDLSKDHFEAAGYEVRDESESGSPT